MYNFYKPQACIKFLIVFLLFSGIENNVNAQMGSISHGRGSRVSNIFKLNVAGLLVGSISLQDEVVFNERFSFALGYNVSLSSLFFPKYILPDNPVNFGDMNISGYSITPEFRYYFKAKAPTGYYLAPYFRYSNYSIDNLDVIYDTTTVVEETATLNGTYKQTAFGFLFGKQWEWGSHFTVDWWIMGIAFGSATIELNAAGDYSDQDISDINTSLQELSVPGTLNYSVTNSLISVNYKQGFPAGRVGFAIGYIF